MPPDERTHRGQGSTSTSLEDATAPLDHSSREQASADEAARMSGWRVRTVDAISSIAPAAWDALASSATDAGNPFVRHAFLAALETSGCVGPSKTGWLPRHLVLEGAQGATIGVAPMYLKTHSQGEYVFDHGWADAFERAGGDYYPKLQIAVPFTPVPGPRFLVGNGPDRVLRLDALSKGAVAVAKALRVSSLHVTFVDEPTWSRLGEDGAYLQRIDQQFHWQNAGYSTFEDFLGALSSRKRKTMRREREVACASSLKIVHYRGADITDAHWDAFFSFYMDTGSRKWGRPYLNRRFFAELGRSMSDACLLVLAERDGKPVAGALNLIGADTLYGRYWGAVEHHPCLHFEVCYYQAIEFAIRNKLRRVEAGAQGEHKLTRGYMPSTTHSLHYIQNPDFRRAVARFLEAERDHVLERKELLAEYAPFRKAVAQADA